MLRKIIDDRNADKWMSIRNYLDQFYIIEKSFCLAVSIDIDGDYIE